MAQWVSSVLTLTEQFSETSSQKLNSSINSASEEFLQCHLNILKYVDGHVYVGKETFIKKLKTNIHNFSLNTTQEPNQKDQSSSVYFKSTELDQNM